MNPTLNAQIEKLLDDFGHDVVNSKGKEGSRSSLNRKYKVAIATLIGQERERITFESAAGNWIGDEHIRSIYAIQNGKIVHQWKVGDGVLRERYGGYTITKEHIVKYGMARLSAPQDQEGE
jgi:hypothetical protein